MAKKLYPVGIQTFEEIRKNGYLYIDKTKYIYRMTHSNGKHFFLSRPRRFGKSLLASTFESYFEGKKELFEGLAIEELEKEWISYPVLHFSMAGGKHMEAEQLENYLIYILEKNEKKFGVTCNSPEPNIRLLNLIESVKQQTGKQLVVLIDEYDAPLLDVVHEDTKLDVLRNIMRNFYSPLKDSEKLLRFVFLTGITRFSQESFANELNHIIDLSMDKEYAGICGFTKEELTQYTNEDIQRMAKELNLTQEDFFNKLTKYYAGFHFTWPSPEIYNPYSTLSCFEKGKIAPYWLDTTALTSFLSTLHNPKSKLNYSTKYIEAYKSSLDTATDIATSNISWLYKNGYITIKDYEEETEIYTLAFPNEEVKEELSKHWQD